MARVLAASEARLVELPGRLAREILGRAQGATQCTVRLVEIAPEAAGERRGPHFHRAFEECIHVLEGSGETQTESGRHPVGPGDTVLIPPGERHATYNTGPGVLKLLCFFPVADIRPGTQEFASWDAAAASAADA
jgi:quercetin dioxygenase-like cupin family protein